MNRLMTNEHTDSNDRKESNRSGLRKFKSKIWLIPALMLVLTACTDGGENGNAANKPGQENSGNAANGNTGTDKGNAGTDKGEDEKPGTDQPSGESVKADPQGLKDVVTAATASKSFSLAMDIQQSMTQQAELMQMQSNMKLDTVKQPFAMYQKVDMNVGGDDETKFEAYMNDSEYFAHDLVTGDWTKMPKESVAEIKGTFSELQTDPGKELAKLEPYLAKMTATEQDGKLIYNLALTGAGHEKLLDDLIRGLVGDRPDADAIIKAAKVQKLDYVITADKATKLPEQIKLVTDVVMTVDGGMIGLKQNITADYSNYNEAKPVTVPDEGKKNAMLPPTEKELEGL
ncbi:hypothetical protein SY83_10615 [Paenibacillus swuensis]|uniref:Lipoprotein n=1 Tax=Paenibacillus swuensis TaxID=1178515 RepID=A0A172TIF6_9BACL|nr:DUF6612 family protein [Paenibacillus swuensis]ANE46647.1 hypothetical protein SY83_10615 [Paenibacillus swuensis]